MPDDAEAAQTAPGSERLRSTVMELDRHAAEQGWDQPIRLYALVPTADLLQREPQLAAVLGVDDSVDEDDLTPVEQEPLTSGSPIEELLGRIVWPEAVIGCALVMERLVVRGSDETLEPPREDAGEWAEGQEGKEEVRMIAGVLRDGSRYSALRMRSYDSESHVLSGEDLIPALTSALSLTFEE